MTAKHQVDDIRAAKRAANTFVRGHALRSEGRAFDVTGADVQFSWDGYGFCSCGDRSPMLGSDRKRRAWHRQHKLDVLRGGAL